MRLCGGEGCVKARRRLDVMRDGMKKLEVDFVDHVLERCGKIVRSEGVGLVWDR